MTKAEALRLIARLCAAFPARPLPKDSVELFVEKLIPIQVERAKPGIENAIDTCRFFPSWVELRAGMRLETATERLERIKVERGLDDDWQLEQRQLMQRWVDYRRDGGRKPKRKPDAVFVDWYRARCAEQGIQFDEVC